MIDFTLILGIFSPRLALLLGWSFGGILPNTIPFFLDFMMTLIAPRLLFIIYIVINWETLGGAGVYLTLHIILYIISWVVRSIKSKNEKLNKKLKYAKYI